MPHNTARRIIGGAGRLAPVHHQIHPQCLIKIRNNDNNCLFLAMQATFVRAARGLSRMQFHYYLHSQKGYAGHFFS